MEGPHDKISSYRNKRDNYKNRITEKVQFSRESRRGLLLLLMKLLDIEPIIFAWLQLKNIRELPRKGEQFKSSHLQERASETTSLTTPAPRANASNPIC